RADLVEAAKTTAALLQREIRRSGGKANVAPVVQVLALPDPCRGMVRMADHREHRREDGRNPYAEAASLHFSARQETALLRRAHVYVGDERQCESDMRHPDQECCGFAGGCS